MTCVDATLLGLVHLVVKQSVLVVVVEPLEPVICFPELLVVNVAASMRRIGRTAPIVSSLPRRVHPV